MDLYGKLEKLTKLLLQKSGKTVTIDAPTTVVDDHTFKLPDVAVSGTSTLVDNDSQQILTNKTLDNPSITNLAGANLLTDAHIASGAAIARSKMASGTVGGVVINNGSGVMIDEAQLAKSRGGFGIDMTNFTPGITATKVIKVDNSLPGTDPLPGVKVYQTVQGAIDAAVAAGATNADMYLIDTAPGIYIENITLYDGIILKGVSSTATIIRGTIASHIGLSTVGAKCTMYDLEFQHSPAASGVSFNLIGAINTHLVNFLCLPAADVAVVGLHCAPAAGQLVIHGLCSVYVQPLVPFTSDIHAWENNGAGIVSVYTSSSYLVSAQTAGDICIVDEEGNGARNYNGLAALAEMSSPVYSGTIRGFCTESASAGTRLSQGGQVRLIGAGSGTAIAFNLDTGTDVSDYLFTGNTAFIDGFTNEYVSYTSVNAVQKIWLNSVNKDLAKSGTGRSIITPYDEKKSGFVEWGAVTGSNYWSISGTNFTVVPAGVGVVRGSPVSFNGNQTIAISQGVNYIYMTSAGVIGKTSSGNAALYSSNIVLFQVLYDGTTTMVFKENHPYEFESAISNAWHRIFGSLLEGTGAIISQFGAASARTIQSAGADVLTDHGLDTTIADSTGAALSLTLAYRGAGGLIKLGSIVNAIPGQFNSGTTLANTNNFVVWRIVVAKDNLEGTAQYFAIADTTSYGNASSANAAITNGTIASIPAELNQCEVVMVGYVIVNGDNTGAGSISSVISARKTFGASFLGGSPSSTANLVSITDIAGPIIDTATTVQSALEEANTNAMKVAVSGTANALVRFDGTSGQLTARALVTCDGAGNMAGVLTVNSHAIPSGTGAIVTVDSADTLTNKTLTTPIIGSFASANHDHSASGANGGLVIAASVTQQGAVSVAAQAFAGVKSFASGVKTDTIEEFTSASGVNVAGVLIKTGIVTNVVSINGVAASVALSGSLATGSNAIYTPASGVTAFEIFLRSTNASGSGATKIYVVQNTAWEYSASETGNEIGTIAVATGTGAVTLTATATGTAKGIVNIVM